MHSPTLWPASPDAGAASGVGYPVAVAHRGATDGGAPENTLAAFAAAADLGYRVVETDVRASADGVAVLAHDADLQRLTGRAGVIAHLPWSDLAALRVAGEPLARLEDLLAVLPHLVVNLDVKEAGAVLPVARAVSAAHAGQRVCVASFSQARRRAALGALAARGLAPASSAARGGVARFLAGARAGLRGRPLRALVGADCLQVPERAGPGGRLRVVDAALLAAAHSAGLAVHVWTVDEAPVMRRLLDWGVDGLITDQATLLREVLRERGAWPA